MRLNVTGVVFYWRGPSPFHFVAVPESESDEIREIASLVTYGWGVIPVEARIGATTWTTSLFPKDGLYLVPLKTAVRTAEGIELGAQVRVSLDIGDATRT